MRKLSSLIPKKMMNHIQLKRLYGFDKKRFETSSYIFNEDNYSYDNLRSKITFHYHSIEKGLSNENFRPGFGTRAFNGLFDALQKYIDLGYPVEDSRFQQGLSTIDAYLAYHQSINVDVSTIRERYEPFKKYLLTEYIGIGGASNIQINTIGDYSKMDFQNLACNRHSVRDFGDEKILKEDICDAIEIATHCPSACNRQPYKVYLIGNKEIRDKVFKIQGGLTTHGKNLQYIILVTSDNQYMNGPHERNHTFIDGGIYLMSLVYALTYKNIATCVMNANFYHGEEEKVRKLLEIKNSEDLIAFIAVGSFPNELHYARSPRDHWNTITKII